MTANTEAGFAETATALALVVVTASVVFFGTSHGAALLLEQFHHPILGKMLWPISALFGFTLVAAAVAAALGGALGILESIASPRLFGRTGYTLLGFGGLAGAIGAAGAALLNWSASTRILPGFFPDGTAGFIALTAAVATSGGLSWWFWRPRNKTALATSRVSTTEPPAPEVVADHRVNRSSEQASEPPTPTPPGRFTVSDEYAEPTVTEDSSGSNSVDFDNLEYDWTTETGVSMDDVGGMTELKRELKTDVVMPLSTGREKADELGIPLPNIVFYGPPGTGKTFMAEALATELELPFAQLSGADVQSKWINESAEKINTLFDEAKTVAGAEGGAVVFLDELDAVLKQRGAGQSHEEDNKVVAEFLNHLQETSEHDILFIGATNRLDALDDAGVRSGRIDKKIHVGKPDHAARESILQAQLRDRSNQLSGEHIERIASRTDGLVASDLESIVVDAARNSAFRRDDDEIVPLQDESHCSS